MDNYLEIKGQKEYVERKLKGLKCLMNKDTKTGEDFNRTFGITVSKTTRPELSIWGDNVS